MAIAILDSVQVFDQEIATARLVAQQSEDLGQHLGVGGAPLHGHARTFGLTNAA
ncbi:MAG: hypothetical protein ABWY07_11030 [Burkholderiales bacterium]